MLAKVAEAEKKICPGQIFFTLKMLKIKSSKPLVYRKATHAALLIQQRKPCTSKSKGKNSSTKYWPWSSQARTQNVTAAHKCSNAAANEGILGTVSVNRATIMRHTICEALARALKNSPAAAHVLGSLSMLLPSSASGLGMRLGRKSGCSLTKTHKSLHVQQMTRCHAVQLAVHAAHVEP